MGLVGAARPNPRSLRRWRKSTSATPIGYPNRPVIYSTVRGSLGRVKILLVSSYSTSSPIGSRSSRSSMKTAVLSEIGVDPKRIAKEQQSAVREAVRAAVYDAASGNVKIELIALHGGNMKQGDTE